MSGNVSQPFDPQNDAPVSVLVCHPSVMYLAWCSLHNCDINWTLLFPSNLLFCTKSQLVAIVTDRLFTHELFELDRKTAPFSCEVCGFVCSGVTFEVLSVSSLTPPSEFVCDRYSPVCLCGLYASVALRSRILFAKVLVHNRTASSQTFHTLSYSPVESNCLGIWH